MKHPLPDQKNIAVDAAVVRSRRQFRAAPKSASGGDRSSSTRASSISAMVLAFLASQHHNIMMLLLALGLSDAAMSFMTIAPVVRDVMLGMSLVMIAVILWQIRDSRRPRSMRIMGAVSIVATLGLSAWSIAHFGM